MGRRSKLRTPYFGGKEDKKRGAKKKGSPGKEGGRGGKKRVWEMTVHSSNAILESFEKLQGEKTMKRKYRKEKKTLKRGGNRGRRRGLLKRTFLPSQNLLPEKKRNKKKIFGERHEKKTKLG